MPELRVNGGRHALDAAGRDARWPRRCATRSASPARRSRATRGTAARAPCSSTERRRSRASRSPTGSAGREVTTIEGLRDHPMVDSFVRADARPVRLLHAGADRLARSRSSRARPSRPPRRSATAWPETSAAAAPIRRSRRRFARGATDPHREGGRGPVRGGLARRRRGRARAVAGRARATSSAGPPPRIDGHARARGEAPFTGDLRLPGHAPHGGAPHPARARARPRGSTSRRHSRRPASARAIGPGDAPVLTARVRLRGRAGRRGLRRHASRQARAALALIDVEWEELEPLLDPDEAVARGRAARTPHERARRPRARPRRGGRRRRGHLPHAGRPPQLDGDPPVGLPLGRRHARGLHLDPVRLGRPRRARGGARDRPATASASSATTWAAASARRTAPDDHTLHRRRARAPHRPARPLRAHAARGDARRRQPERDDPAARRRRPRRRHADRARRRVRQRGRLSGLERDDRRPDADRSTPARTSARRRTAPGSTCRR